ncbi:casein kinase I isoform gamma-3-like protein [Dinothrombium tinctorium]|uniref:Casein kinase I isoform gamma-3-like protein n=1 Tax=Dinothrombium tinctorium TaxID=1965070 RepID=A0A443REP2_9ACAR|nr:casein kinase I isoform gamma-3-like protein [Dinothrombium tinctorium]
MNRHLIGGRYEVGKKIAAGSFGVIRLGKCTDNNEKVIIKLEHKNIKEPTLHLEYRFYKLIGDTNYAPKMFYFGHCSIYNALIIELLGANLLECLELCAGKFSEKTVLQIALKMLDAIEFLHSKRIIHRDLKPENWLLERKTCERSDNLRLSDFGLAKEYIDITTKQHIAFRSDKAIMGNALYLSINAHKHLEQSRRDDLEAIGYILMHFLRSDLPWKITTFNVEDKYEQIGNEKEKTSLEKLCDGFAEEFVEYLHYVRELEFFEKPNYDMLREKFVNLFNEKYFGADREYDWQIEMRRIDERIQKNEKIELSYRE